jgi:putative transcriptional regulator
MDWAAFDALTDDEVEAAALADPDAQPLTEVQLRRGRRVGLAGTIRFKLKLSREDFSIRYHIPLETVRAWERGTMEPDAVALAFLHVIATDPDGVARVLAKQGSALAAE